ncbi:MAG: hypothetical protein IJ524_07345 [Bacteroidales bacterium]|nr:hypothetical protein [Bacteroidales bacterium]
MSDINRTGAVLDEALLHDLCYRDSFKISLGSHAEWDKTIRYVLGENHFGYKPYGQFLVTSVVPEEYEFYVFDKDPRWEEEHNEDICNDFFHGQPNRVGYVHRVLFAGMKTQFKDDFGNDIYTGDIVSTQRVQEFGSCGNGFL